MLTGPSPRFCSTCTSRICSRRPSSVDSRLSSSTTRGFPGLCLARANHVDPAQPDLEARYVLVVGRDGERPQLDTGEVLLSVHVLSCHGPNLDRHPLACHPSASLAVPEGSTASSDRRSFRQPAQTAPPLTGDVLAAKQRGLSVPATPLALIRIDPPPAHRIDPVT